MDNILTHIRTALSVAAPFVFLHFFSRHFYHLSLWDITRWWSSNITKVDNTGAYLLGFLFVFLVLSLSFSSFINVFFLGLVGEKQEMVYLGHSKQSTAVYYDITDTEKKPVSTYDVDRMYNYSFDNLYRSQVFKKDPGSVNTVGTKANRFNLLSVLSVTVSLVLYIMVGAAVFNVYVYPVYISGPAELSLPTDGSQIAFDSIIAQYGISRGWFYGLMLILLFLWLGFAIANPANKVSAPLSPLPAGIKPESTIYGTPVEIQVRYIERRRTTGRKEYETVDSGERYINFEFNQGFTHKVYVVTLISLSSHKNQIKDIESTIATGGRMRLVIEKDLTISIPPVTEQPL